MKTALVFLVGIAGVMIAALAALSLKQFLMMAAVWLGLVASVYVLGLRALERNVREYHE